MPNIMGVVVYEPCIHSITIQLPVFNILSLDPHFSALVFTTYLLSINLRDALSRSLTSSSPISSLKNACI